MAAQHLDSAAWTAQTVARLQARASLLRCDMTIATFADGSGRGLRTEVDIPAHTPMFVVPRSLLVTPRDVALRIMLAEQQQQSRAVSLTSVQWLSCFLLKERAIGCASSFQPYIATLPLDFATCPAHSDYPCRDLLLALFPQLTRELNDQLAAKARDTAAISNTLPDAEDRHIEWAWWSVNTRCITYDTGDARLPLLQDAGTTVLVPFFDMVNHSDDVDVTAHYDQTSQLFTVSVNRFYRSGDQAFISYGPHDNLRLLLHYGFVLPTNRLDVVDISDLLEAAVKSWPESSRVQDVLAGADAVGARANLSFHADGLPSWTLWTVVQALAWATLDASAQKKAPPFTEIQRLFLGETSSLGPALDGIGRKLLKVLASQKFRQLDQRAADAQQHIAVEANDCAEVLWQLHRDQKKIVERALRILDKAELM